MVTVDGKSGFFAVKYIINIDFKKIFLRLVSFLFPKEIFVSILSPNNFGFSITTP
jgi:hypothetical protein